jgi:hypothetical protein
LPFAAVIAGLIRGNTRRARYCVPTKMNDQQMNDQQTTILHNALRLRTLHARIHRTFRQHPRGPEHTAACAQFHAEYDALAVPGGLAAALERFQRFDAPTVELAVQFLEVDPNFDRADSIKQEFARRLKHAPLSSTQRDRLAAVLLRSLRHGAERLFRRYARLAPRVSSPLFRAALACFEITCEPTVAARAQHVQSILRAAAGAVATPPRRACTTVRRKPPAVAFAGAD